MEVDFSGRGLEGEQAAAAERKAPAAIADQLKPLADSGDDYAVVLAAWSLMQAGRWPEGIQYAERAAELGAPVPQRP